MKKQFVFVAILVAMVVLTLPVSLVRAKDIRLKPISGSDCNLTTFEYRDHMIAEGFAVSITADLPFDRQTQIKFGCAVAGLGAPWEESGWGYAHEYNPYVKEMWVKVEGDVQYSAWEDSIVDNTGIGGPSYDFFEPVLTAIGIIFTANDIYDWLAKVYQTPPVAEWNEDAHWSKAISRQGYWVNLAPTFVPYLGIDEPHLQTASANVLSYFTEGGSNILTVTAGAEIYVQWNDLIYGGVVQRYIGTYSVSFLVSIAEPDGRQTTLTISAAQGGTTNPAPGTYVYGYGSYVTVTASAYSDYSFNCWLLDGAIRYDNPITVTMYSDHTLTAYFHGGPGGGCPTLFVWNGTSYVEEGILNIHAESDVTVQHTIQNTPVLKNGFYNLQLRELDNYTSHIDQVKLYAIDGQGEWHLCPLTYAYHSSLGKVKQTLLLDDSNRVDLKPTETIDLKFAPSIAYSETAYFIFEINGYNQKPLTI